MRLFIFGLICLGTSSCASPFNDVAKAAQPTTSISAPIRIGEATIKDEWDDTIQPRVAERTGDGGYIVAGSSGTNTDSHAGGSGGPRGWAVKIDKSGRVLWRYYTGLRDLASVKPGVPISYSIHGAPTYYGVVSMPDGSSLLCGQIPNVPRPGSDKPWGILTRLDPKGTLIYERLLSPQAKNMVGEKGVENLQQCIRWGDGFAIVGSAVRYLPRTPSVGRHDAATFYWVLALDRAGKIRWEKLIPATHIQHAGLSDGNLVLQSHGSDLVFSATDNTDSEVIDLNLKGDIIARKPLHGQFRLIHSVEPEKVIQVWGIERGAPSSEVLTLNDRMDVVERKQGAPNGDCFPRIIYRMPDQSYVLFASILRPNSGGLHAAIAHVDGNLHTVRVFEPLSGSESFVDFGRLDAAAPAADLGTFVVAMSVVTRGLNSSDPSKPGALPDFIRGVDLNFVKVN